MKEMLESLTTCNIEESLSCLKQMFDMLKNSHTHGKMILISKVTSQKEFIESKQTMTLFLMMDFSNRNC